MIRKIYPEGQKWETLADSYVAEFVDIDDLEKRWRNYKVSHPCLSVFTKGVKEIMKATFEDLVEMYEDFKVLGCSVKEKKTICKYLKEKVFNYDCKRKGCKKHNTIIAEFFKKKADELHVYTCFYCDTAYINSYESGSSLGSHFDLDHAIAKADCPLVALSLHNFIPSCPICNERLKGKTPLATNKSDLLRVAPCSEKFDGDSNIHIKVEQISKCTSGYLKNKQHYKIIFRSHGEYKSYVDLFKLEDRYEYHKSEALRLLDLKREYPTSHIRKIAQMFHKTADEVREDIFGKMYGEEEHRCFGKLKRDILN